MGSLFRLTGDTVTPSAGTRVLKASEAAVLLEANAVLDAARERVADMERKAGEAYERRREEGCLLYTSSSLPASRRWRRKAKPGCSGGLLC